MSYAQSNAEKADRLNEDGRDLVIKMDTVADPAAKDALLAAANGNFRAAYALDPLPKYLFNIAQTASLMDECPVALGAASRYVEIGEALPPDKRDRQALELAREHVAKYDGKCKPSGDFDAAAATDPDTTPIEDDEEPDEPDSVAVPAGPVPAGPEGPPRQWGWVGLTAGFATLAIGSGAYGLYLVGRLRDEAHYDTAFQAAYAADPYPGAQCDGALITPGPKEACEAGKRAVIRRNVAIGVAGSAAILAGVSAYFAFRTPSSTQTTVSQGPGDFGLSVSVVF